jgi:hypothetical protein
VLKYILRIGIAGIEQRGLGSEKFGVMEQELALAISSLVAALRSIGAAMIFQIELAIPGRQESTSRFFELAEEIADISLMSSR